MEDDLREYSTDTLPFFVALKTRLLALPRDRCLLAQTVAALCLVAIVIGLGVSLAMETKKYSDMYSGLQEQSEPGKPSALCVESPCLQMAAHSQQCLDANVSPCHDFYQYSCGRYPVSSLPAHNSVLDDLAEANRDIMEDILSSDTPVGDHTAEAKLREIYKACMDEFRRDVHRGRLVVDLLGGLGGWWVMDQGDNATWSLDRALKYAHGRLGVDVLWSFALDFTGVHTQSHGIFVKVTAPTRKPDLTHIILQSDLDSRVHGIYNKYVRHVTYLLLQDAKLELSDNVTQKVDTFAEDVFTLELKLSETVAKSKLRYHGPRILLLRALASNKSSQIDWYKQVTSAFDISDPDTPVTFDTYADLLLEMIASLPANSSERMLNSYTTWRVIQEFIPDLSAEYRHAEKVFLKLLGAGEKESLESNCFDWVSKDLQEVLGSLFLRHRFQEASRKQVTEIGIFMRKELQDSIAKSSWMDNKTKKIAIEKARKMQVKIGFPGELMNETAVDVLYKKLEVPSRADVVGCKLAVHEMRKRQQSALLRQGWLEDAWLYPVFSSKIENVNELVQIEVPAGFLQLPVYDLHLPLHITLATVGSHLGHHFTHVVDDIGRWWGVDGRYMDNGGWWTEQTLGAYYLASHAIRKALHLRDPNNSALSNNPTPWAEVKVAEMFGQINGIRLAYKVYKSYTKLREVENLLPGLELTPSQRFFLSYAQTQCTDRRVEGATADISSAMSHSPLPVDYQESEAAFKVNLAMQLLPEFSSAFQCPADSPMNPRDKLDLL